MNEVIRLLGNEQWADILARRQERQNLIGACVLGGLALLGIFLLAKGNETA